MDINIDFKQEEFNNEYEDNKSRNESTLSVLKKSMPTILGMMTFTIVFAEILNVVEHYFNIG